jgi:hypothetical protein
MDGLLGHRRSVSKGCDRPELARPRTNLWFREMTIDICPRPERLSQDGCLPCWWWSSAILISAMTVERLSVFSAFLVPLHGLDLASPLLLAYHQRQRRSQADPGSQPETLWTVCRKASSWLRQTAEGSIRACFWVLTLGVTNDSCTCSLFKGLPCAIQA